jgi:hypothetical protein
MNMKYVVMAVLAVVMGSQAALADGFVCDSEEAGLRVRVYNHTNPSEGTRNAAVMVLSDLSVGHGRKTIAKFTSATEKLWNTAALYEAKVDLRYSDSNRKGELVAGTKLGYIDTLALDIAFSYGAPVEAGEEMEGKLSIQKRDGSEIALDMLCSRYLKN